MPRKKRPVEEALTQGALPLLHPESFYQDALPSLGANELIAAEKIDLDDEIAVIHLMAKKVVKLLHNRQDLESVLEGVNVLGVLQLRLVALLKAKNVLKALDKGSVITALSEALKMIQDEMDPLKPDPELMGVDDLGVSSNA